MVTQLDGLTALIAYPSRFNSMNSQINPVSNTPGTFEPMMQFWYHWDLECYSVFYDWKHLLKPFQFGGAVKLREKDGDLLNKWMNDLLTKVFVEQPLATSVSPNY